MKIFDLHCDTVFECLDKNKSLIKNDLDLDVERVCGYDGYIQTFAFWISDKLRGDAAYNHFLAQHDLFTSNAENSGGLLKLWDKKTLPEKGCCNAILAVEGGAALGGEISRIDELKKRGISILTLCWNGGNEIASGIKGSGGFTPFGREVVRRLEQEDIFVDVSHLNDQGFFELCDFAEKPFIASHSNSRSVHDNPRNLNDAQITELVGRKGLIGLNFYVKFVGGKSGFDELARHIDHFLKLGCIDILTLGSDFDGAKTSEYLGDVSCLAVFYEDTAKKFGNETADKIFFTNAFNFFTHQNSKDNK